MASNRKDISENLNNPSPFRATVCSFFGSPTVWSLLSGGISGAAGYTGIPNITALIASIGGGLSYLWAGALTPKNEADRDFFIGRVDAELQKIAANLALSTDTVTILQNDNGQNKEDGYYLYVQNDEINAIVVKNREERRFSLGPINDPNNFIFQLVDWGNIDEPGDIIGGRLGLLLSSLIEAHQDHPKEDKVEVSQDPPELSRRHYLSGINVASASVITLQLAALALCVFESVKYSENLDSADQSSTGNEAELSSQYLLAASIIKMGSALSYWFLRKYEDTSKEQKSEQYRKSLEHYNQSKSEEKQERILAWAGSMLIIAECKGKVERLSDIKDKLEVELRKIEYAGEKDEISRDISEKIESLVGDFKRILAEARGESCSEEININLTPAEDNINRFMEDYNQERLHLAFDVAKEEVLNFAKNNLQAKQGSEERLSISL